MEKKDLRIVYMGTPEFAVESLKRLVEGGYQVVGVITMPDKPMGRHGSVLQPSPVKQYAVSQGLKVLQPEKLKDENFLAELRDLKADLQIVVAFRMLPEVVWNMPRLGTFNLHASLLPQYRGAAPINWAVINGETETGITTFFLKHEIDTGEIIDQVRVPIADTDNVEIVYDKLMHLGGDLVVKTVDAILEGNVKTIPQEQLAAATELRPAPKIFKETWYTESMNLDNEYRKFTDGNFGLNDVSMGEPYTWKSGKSREGLVSVFGRLSYNFKERYLFTGTLRADGSSKFAKGNQWGIFPSASAAWRISEEAFRRLLFRI